MGRPSLGASEEIGHTPAYRGCSASRVSSPGRSGEAAIALPRPRGHRRHPRRATHVLPMLRTTRTGFCDGLLVPSNREREAWTRLPTLIATSASMETVSRVMAARRQGSLLSPRLNATAAPSTTARTLSRGCPRLDTPSGQRAYAQELAGCSQPQTRLPASNVAAKRRQSTPPPAPAPPLVFLVASEPPTKFLRRIRTNAAFAPAPPSTLPLRSLGPGASPHP